MATATVSLNGGVAAETVAVNGADADLVAVNGTDADPVAVNGTDAETAAVNGTAVDLIAVTSDSSKSRLFKKGQRATGTRDFYSAATLAAINGAATDGSLKRRLFKKGQRATGTGEFYDAAALAAFNGAATDGSLKPQLFIRGQRATEAVEFYKAAFGAEEVSRAVNPKRKADGEAPLGVSVELKIGSGSILVNDHPDPEDKLRTTVTFMLMTAEMTKAVEKAVAAGAFADDEI